MKNTPEIYPIYLADRWAEQLVKEHASAEFREKTCFHSRFAEYGFSAKVMENGEVELFVTFSSDDGFIRQSGPCFSKRVRIFTDERLQKFKEDRMFQIAEVEFYRRQRDKELKEIAKVQKELFGE
jgi:hypothetical protein